MLYLHVPFCHRKCLYCTFYSRPESEATMQAYVQALTVEMQLRHSELSHPPHTLYLGGGTPSILPLPMLEQIVEALHQYFDLSQLEEATLEANPEDITPGWLSALRSLGFNRLSFGLQRASDDALQMLGRRHTLRQALAAIEAAHAAGFDNLSVDFIYGLPQPPDFLNFPLDGIAHVSAYALTVEPRTALAVQVAQGRFQLPPDDEVARQYHQVGEWLARHEFYQYEVSNFARLGKTSRHNSGYWNRTPYLGLGPSAHNYDGLHRQWNLSDTHRYIASLTASPATLPIEGRETLTPADAFNEWLMTSLRTTRGLPYAEIPPVHRSALQRKVQPYIAAGWLEATTDAFRPTAEGLLHADGMAAALFV